MTILLRVDDDFFIRERKIERFIPRHGQCHRHQHAPVVSAKIESSTAMGRTKTIPPRCLIPFERFSDRVGPKNVREPSELYGTAVTRTIDGVLPNPVAVTGSDS
jgi:hypothetical protein